MNIPAELKGHIAALAQASSAQRVVLFGSRARGDNADRSDIDLAVYGLPAEQIGPFRLALEDLPTLLSFDFVPIDADTALELLAEIKRDGVILYESETDQAI